MSELKREHGCRTFGCDYYRLGKQIQSVSDHPEKAEPLLRKIASLMNLSCDNISNFEDNISNLNNDFLVIKLPHK